MLSSFFFKIIKTFDRDKVSSSWPENPVEKNTNFNFLLGNHADIDPGSCSPASPKNWIATDKL